MNRVEIIADFLCNGLEHCDTEEAVEHLVGEVGLCSEQARRLITAYLKSYSAVPIVLNDELFPFIEKHLLN